MNSAFVGYFLLLLSTLMIGPSSVSAVCTCNYTVPTTPIFGPGTNGCQITSPAAAGFACQCTWTAKGCSGSQVLCNNALNNVKFGWDLSKSQYCTKPDTSFFSCMVGGGNCGGYSANWNSNSTTNNSTTTVAPATTTTVTPLPPVPTSNCTCAYNVPTKPIFGPGTNGCQITVPSIKNWACQCTWIKRGTSNQCVGQTVFCNNLLNLVKYGWNLSASQYCINPDTSFYSCMLGGGNCGGYSNATTVVG